MQSYYSPSWWPPPWMALFVRICNHFKSDTYSWARKWNLYNLNEPERALVLQVAVSPPASAGQQRSGVIKRSLLRYSTCYSTSILLAASTLDDSIIVLCQICNHRQSLSAGGTHCHQRGSICPLHRRWHNRRPNDESHASFMLHFIAQEVPG